MAKKLRNDTNSDRKVISHDIVDEMHPYFGFPVSEGDYVTVEYHEGKVTLRHFGPRPENRKNKP